jgi:hypothetical protein
LPLYVRFVSDSILLFSLAFFNSFSFKFFISI